MIKIFTVMLFILLTLGGLAACNSNSQGNSTEEILQTEEEQPIQKSDKNKNSKVEFYTFNTITIFALEDLVKPFSKPELLLKPQGEGDYPVLNGVEAKAYELSDGAVFIHVYENNGDLEKGLEQFDNIYEPSKWGLKVYKANNILFVYEPAYATEELVKENDKKLKDAIEEMIKTKENY